MLFNSLAELNSVNLRHLAQAESTASVVDIDVDIDIDVVEDELHDPHDEIDDAHDVVRVDGKG